MIRQLVLVAACGLIVCGANCADYVWKGTKGGNWVGAFWEPVSGGAKAAPVAGNHYWQTDDPNRAQANNNTVFPEATLHIGSDADSPTGGAAAGNVVFAGTASRTRTIDFFDLVWHNGTLWGNAGSAAFDLSGNIKIMQKSSDATHVLKVSNATQRMTLSANVESEANAGLTLGAVVSGFTLENVMSSLSVGGVALSTTLSGDFSKYKGSFDTVAFNSVIFKTDNPLGDPDTPNASAMLLETDAVIGFDGDFAQSANRGFDVVGTRAYLMTWESIANAYMVKYPIRGTGMVVKHGPGTVTLNCSYSAGVIEVDAGTLVLAASASFPAGQKVMVGSGATLVANLVTNGFDIVVSDGGTFVYDPMRPEFHWQPVGGSVIMEDPANWGADAFRADAAYVLGGAGTVATGTFPGGTLVVGNGETDGSMRLTSGTVTVPDLEWSRGSIYGNNGNRNFTLAGDVRVVGAAADAQHRFYVTTETQNLTVEADVKSDDDAPKVTFADPNGRASLVVMLAGSKNKFTLSGDWSGYKGTIEVAPFVPVVFKNDNPLGDPSVAKPSALVLETNAGFAIDGDFEQNANRGIEITGDQAYLLAWESVGNGAAVRYPVHGSGKLIKAGAGTVTLDCAYSAGGIEVDAGTLVLAASASFPAGQKVTVKSGATLVANLVTNGFDIVVSEGGTFVYDPKRPEFHWQPVGGSVVMEDSANWGADAFRADAAYVLGGAGTVATGTFAGGTLVVGSGETDGSMRLTPGSVTIPDLEWSRGSIYGNNGNRNFMLAGNIWVMGAAADALHRFYVTTDTQNLTVEANVASDDDTPKVTFADPNGRASLAVMLAGSKNVFTLSGDWSGYKGTIGVAPFVPVVFRNDNPLGDPSVAKPSALVLETNAGFAIDGDFEQSANRGIEIAGDQAYLLAWESVGNGAAVRYPVHGPGKLIKAGAGTATLSGDYSAGDIEVADGTLVLSESSSFPAGQKVTVKSGATLVANLVTNGFDIAVSAGGTFVYNPPVKTTTWVGAADGVWSDPSNWDNGVPGFGDTVVLTASSENDLAGLTLGAIAFGGVSGTVYRVSGEAVTIADARGLSVTAMVTVTNELSLTFAADQCWDLLRESSLHHLSPLTFGSHGLTLNADPGTTRYSDVALAGELHLWADNGFAAGTVITNHTVHLYAHGNATFGLAKVVLPTTVCDDSGSANKANRASLSLDGVTLANDIEIKEFNAATAGQLKLRALNDTTNEVSGAVTFTQSGPKFVYIGKNAQLTLSGPVRMDTPANFRFPGYNQTLSTCVLAADGQTFHSLGSDRTADSQSRIALAGRNLTISTYGLFLTKPGNIIRFDADDVFGSSPSHREYVRGGCGTVDLNGHSQHIRGFNALEGDTSKGLVSSVSPAALYVCQAYDIGPWAGRFMKMASLVKSGAKPLSLAGASASSGTAEVTEGDLEFTETGSWAGVVKVSGTGHLIVNGDEAVTRALHVVADVENPTVRISIPAGQSITVKDFYVNGVLQRAKEFDATDFGFIEGGTIVNEAASHETSTAVWTGEAGTGIFSDAGNWQNGAMPYDGDAVRLTAPGTVSNDLRECTFSSLTIEGAGALRIGGGLGTADVTVPAGLALEVDAPATRVGNGCLNVRGTGTLAFLRETSERLSRVDVLDGATVSVTSGTGLRTAVLELKGNSRLAVAGDAAVDAFSVVVDDGMPLAKGTYAAQSGTGVTRLSRMDGAGRLVVGTVTARQNARTKAVLDGFKNLSATGKWLASCRTPWGEIGSGFRKKVNGKWTDREPEETDPDNCDFYRTAGVHPYLYFLDFNAVAGTYRGDLSYEQGRAQLRGIIRSTYKRWGAIPAFSWHMENPYAPTAWSDPDEGSNPYRYRYLCAGYPQEHRYVLKEMLENTGAACGAGRQTEALAVDAPTYRNPKRWLDERLDEIAAFLNTLRDENGQRIPVVIRLFHECEDNWSFWDCCWAGAKSVSEAEAAGSASREDYKKAFAYVVNGLRWRTGGDGTLLFGYCTDRYCTSWGESPDHYRDYLYRYPGDDVVDILGFDDYSIGAAQTDSANESALAATVKKIKAVTAIAESREKACGLFETGISSNPDSAYVWHYKAMTSSGCRFAFLNTWGDQTIPKTDVGKAKMAEYMAKPEVVAFPNAYFIEPTVSVNETYSANYEKLVLDVGAAGCWAATALVVTLKDSTGGSVLATVNQPLPSADAVTSVDLSGWMTPGQSYVYDLKFAGSYDGKALDYGRTGYPVSLVTATKVTVEGRKIRLSANTVADLTDSELSDGTEYEVESAAGKIFRLLWKDAKSDGKTVRYAVVFDGKLIVRAGSPANGLESFASHALGLDPTKELAKPAAVVKAGGLQSATGVTVHVPNIVKENLPDAGVEVLFQRQKSVDGGKTWTDDGDPAKVGGELTIPFAQGTLYRVNTVLR